MDGESHGDLSEPAGHPAFPQETGIQCHRVVFSLKIVRHGPSW